MPPCCCTQPCNMPQPCLILNPQSCKFLHSVSLRLQADKDADAALLL
jgi:hypothetical protein